MTATKKTIKNVEAKVTEAVEATVEAAVKATEKATSSSIDQVAAATKASSEAFKGYEDVLAYSTGNFDAVVKASDIWMKGVQDFGAILTGLAEASVEKNAAVATQLFACKTVEEAVNVQSDFAVSSYDAAVVEGRKLSDMGTKIAETASQPLKSRMDETVATFTKSIAA